MAAKGRSLSALISKLLAEDKLLRHVPHLLGVVFRTRAMIREVDIAEKALREDGCTSEDGARERGVHIACSKRREDDLEIRWELRVRSCWGLRWWRERRGGGCW